MAILWQTRLFLSSSALCSSVVLDIVGVDLGGAVRLRCICLLELTLTVSAVVAVGIDSFATNGTDGGVVGVVFC